MFRLLLCLLFLCSCSQRSSEYEGYYKHLKHERFCECWEESDCFILFLVDARHLDYTESSHMIKTMSKHPSDGSKNSDVGHAWIYLRKGDEIIEGGHSAETGVLQPRYVEGVVTLSEKGDPNPARYLWCTQKDGHFQKGAGGHKPTFAVKVNLTQDQHDQICRYLQNYPYDEYAITDKSCTSLVVEIAQLLGMNLEHKVTLSIDSEIHCGGETIKMWSDPSYSCVTFGTPDRLERSLIELCQRGEAKAAKSWYLKQCYEPFRERCARTVDDLQLLPERSLRSLYLQYR